MKDYIYILYLLRSLNIYVENFLCLKNDLDKYKILNMI